MLVKICGFANAAGAGEAVRAGADYVGLLVDVSDSRHSIAPSKARGIVDEIGAEKTVVLTWLTRESQLLRLVEETGAGGVQVVREAGVKALHALKKRGVSVWKTVNASANAPAQAREYAPFVDFLVVDTRVGRQRGGTGKAHDWRTSAEVVLRVGGRVFLAGGLNTKNVARAIEFVKPAGVDVNTGVEERGEKTLERMRDFVKAAKKRE